MKNYTLIITTALFLITFSGCEKKDDSQSSSCAAKIKKAGDNTNAKLTAYLNNSTTANCKAAYQALSEQIKAYESCASVTGLSLADLNELKRQLATLDCD